MPDNHTDAYRIVTTKKLVKIGPKAILVQTLTGEEWIARSLLHGGDDIKLARAREGGEHTFRVREWVAEKLGFA